MSAPLAGSRRPSGTRFVSGFQSALTVLLLVVPASLSTAVHAGSESAELLARSIAYHDPGTRWGGDPLELSFDESRPDGSVRKTRVVIDPRHQRFEWWSQRGGDVLEGALIGAECSLALNGSGEFSDEEREAHRLDCDRLTLYRDYYTYLWGLPMKLRDPGTRIDPEVGRATFEGRQVLSLRVTYDPEVGSDTWYFYFDPPSAALVGYRFFHDAAENDGEYIVLEGEVGGAGLRLPRTRTWYMNADQRLLGSDTLTTLIPAARD